VIVWAGNIGPATEAAKLVFQKKDFVSNRDLANIRDQIGDAEYYKIMFDVLDIKESKPDGRHIPGRVSCRTGSTFPLKPAAAC
jgi:hypothetical protein